MYETRDSGGRHGCKVRQGERISKTTEAIATGNLKSSRCLSNITPSDLAQDDSPCMVYHIVSTANTENINDMRIRTFRMIRQLQSISYCKCFKRHDEGSWVKTLGSIFVYFRKSLNHKDSVVIKAVISVRVAHVINNSELN